MHELSLDCTRCGADLDPESPRSTCPQCDAEWAPAARDALAAAERIARQLEQETTLSHHLKAQLEPLFAQERRRLVVGLEQAAAAQAARQLAARQLAARQLAARQLAARQLAAAPVPVRPTPVPQAPTSAPQDQTPAPVAVQAPDQAADAVQPPDPVELEAAARALETLPAEPPEPPAKPAPKPPASPTIWARLGPAFAENLLFILGGFLLLAGAVYFVSTAWTTMTGRTRLLVVQGGVTTLGALLLGAGKLFNRGRRLDDLESVLATVTGSLVSLTAVAAGRLWLEDPIGGAIGTLFWAVPGYFALRHAGRLRAEAWRQWLPRWGLMVAAVAVAAPFCAQWALGATAVACVIGLLSVRRARPPAAILAPVAVALLASGAHLAVVAHEIAVFGVILAALGLAAVWLRRALEDAQDLVGLGLCVGGMVPALLNPTAALLAALFGTLGATTSAVYRRKISLMLPALVFSLLSYVLLPAPAKQLVLSLRDQAAAGLGYGGGKLPLSWYGVTCLPYIAAMAWGSRRLMAASRPRLAAAVRIWTVFVSLSLCVLAIAGGDDPRAPMVVLPAEGLLLLAIGLWLRERLFLTVAPILLLAAVGVAGWHLNWPDGAMLCLALMALGASRLLVSKWGGPVSDVGGISAPTIGAALAAVWAFMALGDASASAWDLGAVCLVLSFTARDPMLRPIAALCLGRAALSLGELWHVMAPPIAMPVFAAACLAVWQLRRPGKTLEWMTAVALAACLAVIPLLSAQTDALPALKYTLLLSWPLLLWLSHLSRSTSLAIITNAAPIAAAGLIGVALGPADSDWSSALAIGPCLMVVVSGVWHRTHRASWSSLMAPGLPLLLPVTIFFTLGTAAFTAMGRPLSSAGSVALATAFVAAMVMIPRTSRWVRWPAFAIGLCGLLLGAWRVVPTHPEWQFLMVAAVVRGLSVVLPSALPVSRRLIDPVIAGTVSITLLIVVSTSLSIQATWVLLAAAAVLWSMPRTAAQALFISSLTLMCLGPIAIGQFALSLNALPTVLFVVLGVLYQASHLRVLRLPRSELFALTGASALLVLGIEWQPELAEGVLTLGPRHDGIWGGINWLSFAALGTLLWPRDSRTLALRGLLLPALIWWAPLASLLSDTPLHLMARADMDVAVWMALIAWRGKRQKHWLIPLAIIALALTGVELSDLSTLLTAAVVATAFGMAAFRTRTPLFIELATYSFGYAALSGVSLALTRGHVGDGTPLVAAHGIALIGAALVSAAVRGQRGTTWLLTLTGIALAGYTPLSPWLPISLGAATAVIALMAWRSRSLVATEAILPMAATAVLASLSVWHALPITDPTLHQLGAVVFGIAMLLGAFTKRRSLTLAGLGVIAATLTHLDTLSGWTPVTAGLIAAAVCVLQWRTRRQGSAPVAIDMMAFTALLTACWITATPLHSAHMAPLLSVAAALALWINALRHPVQEQWAHGWLLTAVMTIGMLWPISLQTQLSPLEGACALLAPALTFDVWRKAEGRYSMLHRGVLLLALSHLMLVYCTPWLSLLDGHHLQLWGGLAPGVLAARPLLAARHQTAASGYALGFAALPFLSASTAGSLAFAALIASVTIALFGRTQPDRRWHWLALAFANLGACALCFDADLRDPTFYGILPGLSLLFAAEVERQRVRPALHLSLFIGGLAVGYGSVALQVLRVGSPLHAVGLLALGLGTVFLGWRLKRAALLLGGAAAVVLDVSCYLLRNGFQHDFTGAGLLLLAGGTVLGSAALIARQRRTVAP